MCNLLMENEFVYFQHEVNDGSIVMVNSMSGHRVTMASKLKFYSATKFAVTALVEGFRQELRQMEPKNKIRVAQVLLYSMQSHFRQDY